MTRCCIHWRLICASAIVKVPVLRCKGSTAFGDDSTMVSGSAVVQDDRIRRSIECLVRRRQQFKQSQLSWLLLLLLLLLPLRRFYFSISYTEHRVRNSPSICSHSAHLAVHSKMPFHLFIEEYLGLMRLGAAACHAITSPATVKLQSTSRYFVINVLSDGSVCNFCYRTATNYSLWNVD